ncbi:17034_t:CDS:2, partial [Cetraspora pellucida]
NPYTNCCSKEKEYINEKSSDIDLYQIMLFEIINAINEGINILPQKILKDEPSQQSKQPQSQHLKQPQLQPQQQNIPLTNIIFSEIEIVYKMEDVITNLLKNMQNSQDIDHFSDKDVQYNPDISPVNYNRDMIVKRLNTIKQIFNLMYQAFLGAKNDEFLKYQTNTAHYLAILFADWINANVPSGTNIDLLNDIPESIVGNRHQRNDDSSDNKERLKTIFKKYLYITLYESTKTLINEQEFKNIFINKLFLNNENQEPNDNKNLPNDSNNNEQQLPNEKDQNKQIPDNQNQIHKENKKQQIPNNQNQISKENEEQQI